ncbi:MAG: FAD-binding oxidoreductase, partial [Spirochaetota bacterium]
MPADTQQTKGKSLYLPMKARITRAEQLTDLEKFFEIELLNGETLSYLPGQFVEVSVFGYGEVPISISSPPTKPGGFELCVRKVGKVTAALHSLEKGSIIGIRGPFGNGFNTQDLKKKDLLFIGGGIGLVPLRSLIKYVIEHKKDYGKITILYGAKTPAELLFRDELKQWESEEGI